MASSNIKLFDENKGNMLSDSEFSISNQRMNGLQTGVASSQLQNKAMYQASLVAYAIAQIMMQNGKNANDTDAVSAFVANLSSTMLQKVYDLASTEEAQAGAATGKWMSPALVKAAIDTLAAKAQNILSDATKVLYGLDSSAVPDDVFIEIAKQLSKVPAASIFVTGLSETDTVTATNGSKTLTGKWMQKLVTQHFNNLIPNMTSNTEPSGVASSSAIAEGQAFNAFDGKTSTYCYGGGGVFPWTVQYEFEKEVDIDSFSYRVSTATSDDGAATVYHEVQVSSDGKTWETIWSGSTDKGASNPKSETIDLSANKKCKFIRWNNTSSSLGASVASEMLYEFQASGYMEVQAGGFEISPIRDFGTWTVTATNGTKTATQDVLVDVITNYEIEMSLTKLWLYRYGEEFEDNTGGWSADGWVSGVTSIPNVEAGTKNANNLYIHPSGTGDNKLSLLSTVNRIPLQGYSKLKLDVNSISINNNICTSIVLNTEKIAYSGADQVELSSLASNGTGRHEWEFDISDYTGEMYVCLCIYDSARSSSTYKVWLE